MVAGWCVAGGLGAWACAPAGAGADKMPASALLSQPTAATTPPPPAARSVAPIRAPALDPVLVARAQELVATARKAYFAGAYDRAEATLKEAVVLYPFVAEANLMLGKIFLLKGSAARDLSLVNSARLMFEMAHTIDPTLREAEVLLDLFKHEPVE